MKKQAQIFRKGSALLIVLGMSAFMVISAVSFAIYMRESRVPSSHLRRESTARYLLKSALANAVARLNGNFKTNYEIWGENGPSGKHYNYLDTTGYVEGLYDDQYPGLNDFTILGHNGDYWTKHVFTPFGQVAPTTTVSTLTLEGLAYLPPALINEARVFSRTTRTAQWQNLSYDLGRYAFCAIDVSDCFDINKLASAKRRTSHPSERISLTSLYPDEGIAFANKIEGKTSTVPFVSLADFNVAMGTTPFTPFARYINTGGNNGYIYEKPKNNNDDDAIVKNALFITDTWFPATNAYLTADLKLETPEDNVIHYDIAEGHQPFAQKVFDSASTFEYIRPNDALDFPRMLEQNLGGVGLACLYDYLDRDQVPISLALPTVEAVPMVCAVDISGNPKVVFEVSTPQEDNWSFEDPKSDPTTRKISRSVSTVSFKGLDLNRIFVHGTVMFPFKRFKSEQRHVEAKYSVEALVAVYFGSSDMKCRLDDDCRQRFQPTEDDWKEGGYRNGIFFYKGTDQLNQINDLINKDIKTEKEAFAEFSCKLEKLTNERSCTVCRIVNEEEKSSPNKAGDPPITPLNLDENVYTIDGIEKGVTTFMLYDEVGAEAAALAELYEKKKKKIYSGAERAKEALNWIQGVEATATKQTDCSNTFNDEGGVTKEKYTPYIAVWVRVVNQDGETVDLVPATLYDDEVHFGVKYKGHHVFDPFCGAGVPLLDFKDNRSDMEFAFDSKKLTAMPAFEPQVWKSLYAVDPRYNFAPEDWFGDASLKEAGLANWRELVMGTKDEQDGFRGNKYKEGRSRDIFMFTSDQEYLQSIGELQFLPYVQPLGGSGVSLSSCDFKDIDRYDGANFEKRTSADAKFANNPEPNSTDYRCRFWKTYSGYDKTAANPFTGLKFGSKAVSVENGVSEGFRVNPLSPDLRVLSAAIVDTPWDYYISGTNLNANTLIKKLKDGVGFEDYTFGLYSTLSADQWSTNAVTQIARAINNEVRDAAIYWMQHPEQRKYPFDWMSSYVNLWADYADVDTETQLFGHELGNNCKLHDVDRKFLFSFWRDCFQNRQQLFLIFLRAEPLAAGAGGVANAQLGARGVALVWRDPAPPKSIGNQVRTARGNILTREDWLEELKNCPPHRTRVLFYHQFE